MRLLTTSALLLQAYVGLAEDTSVGDYLAPGRADRMLAKRAPKDYGTFKPDCKGSEGACNNACYYIRCQARANTDANKITYIGPNGNNGEDDRNRIESGCNFDSPSSGSVCTNFPFSQKFSDKTATDYQCDEWPPAVSQQETFANKKVRNRNSLRCMPGKENGSLGAKLRNYIYNQGGPYPGRPGGVMSRGDFFRVDFQAKIGSADQSKVGFCLQQQPDCSNDGMQFGMTAKPLKNGKISSPYNNPPSKNKPGNDNRYALQNTVYKDLFQCGVSFTRKGDDKIDDVILDNWENKDVQTTKSCTLAKDGSTCLLKGLPVDLQLKRTGKLGTKIDFVYDPGQQNRDVNYFTWDSETSGNGRGPWTDGGHPLRYCKVVRGNAANEEHQQCWFPCYQTHDGR